MAAQKSSESDRDDDYRSSSSDSGGDNENGSDIEVVKVEALVERIRQVASDIAQDASPVPNQPSLLDGTLKDYQAFSRRTIC
jgi:hypothetical protein